MKLRAKVHPVKTPQGIAVKNIDKVPVVLPYHITYVFRGSRCVEARLELDEDWEFTLNDRKVKVKEVLRAAGLTLKDIAKILEAEEFSIE